MIEAVNTFLKAIKGQGHILPLIENADFCVSLIGANKSPIILAFQRGEVFLAEAPADYQISGSELAITKLLEGKERLRVLEKKGYIKINSPLRAALLMETIFYLTKAEQHEKIFNTKVLTRN